MNSTIFKKKLCISRGDRFKPKLYSKFRASYNIQLHLEKR